MNVKTINDRIIEAADKRLRAEIEEAAKPLDCLLRNGCHHTILVTDSDGKEIAEVPWYRALEALRVRAFEMAYEKNRDRAIAEFVGKVARLNEEMEELRQMAE